METFKAIIRDSVAANAHQVMLTVGKEPDIVDDVGMATIEGFQTCTPEWINNLFGFLFPNDQDALASGQPVKGILNIPNLGKVLLIGQKSQESFLNLYFPGAGEQLFHNDWDRFINPGQAINQNVVANLQATANPMPVAPPQNPAPMGIPQDQEMQYSDEEAIPVAENHPAMIDPPPLPNLDEDIPHSLPNYEQPVMQSSYDQVHMQPSYGQAALKIAEPYEQQEINKEEILENAFSEDDGGRILISDGSSPLDKLLISMIERQASDLHLTVGQPVTFRINGDIVRLQTASLNLEDLKKFLIPIVPERNALEFADIFDTDFAYEIRNVARFRINLFKDNHGLGCVIRFIPNEIPKLESLNAPKTVADFCRLSKGLVLVTGPTGSGKSTTLAAMIDLINETRSDHIITIEDPIEFVHSQKKCLINQREVGRHTTSFDRALKAALREDPDVILVGEMRDLKTVSAALEMAETGHLVLGTLHTNTAVSTIDRIIDIFPGDQQSQVRTMLSSTLKGVISQTLLKKREGGMIAAYEILVSNDAVASLIRESKNYMIQNHMQTQKGDGNITQNDALIALLMQKYINFSEAWNHASDKKAFVDLARRRGIPINFDGVSPMDRGLIAK